MGEIHLGRFSRSWRMFRIRLVDQSIVAIFPVCLEWWLPSRSSEKRRHHWSVSIVLVHWRNAQQCFDGVNQIHGRIKTRIYERMIHRPRRIFADHVSCGAMCIHVIGSVLGIVFQYENCCVIPVGTVRYSFNYTAYSQVIVSHGGGNDLAVGRVVEAVSNSPYWDDTAVLI